jgi:hypothetical protein
MASKKSRTTFNKVARERELRERRELKREKKEAARIAKAAGHAPPEYQIDVDTNGAETNGAETEQTSSVD